MNYSQQTIVKKTFAELQEILSKINVVDDFVKEFPQVKEALAEAHMVVGEINKGTEQFNRELLLATKKEEVPMMMQDIVEILKVIEMKFPLVHTQKIKDGYQYFFEQAKDLLAEVNRHLSGKP